MLERVGNKDILVRNYTSNFDIKQFVQDVLIPEAFPDIPMNKLNLGHTGVTSELISHAMEDVFGTASLMLNESFITRAVLPSSIYSEASLFNIGYTFSTPSRCNFAVQMWIDDIVRYSSQVKNTLTKRYKLDKDTKLILADNTYRFDYDIIIDHQIVDGKRAFNIYYDVDESNSITIIKNQYINHQVSSIGWLVLFVELQEFDRKIEENTISDNLTTSNSDLMLRWSRQIAGMDLIYITPKGERLPMKKKNQYTRPEQDPFAWYSFINDTTLRLTFSGSRGFFQPIFNSKIESTIYTCKGEVANFDYYDNRAAVPVQRTGRRFEYNANTRIVALSYSGSYGGTDRGDIELLRDDVILAHNSVNVLSTDYDLKLWFNNFAKRYGTKAEFFKRRDDPTGRLFSQFIAITDNNYVYPTNTLTIDVSQSEFDFINNDNEGNNKEFIIKPGHLWEYKRLPIHLKTDKLPLNRSDWEDVFAGARIQVNDSIYVVTNIDSYGHIECKVTSEVFSRDTVQMVHGPDGISTITDEALPNIGVDRPFMFVNPFYIKLHRYPTISATYNYLIDHTSWPENIPVQSDVFYQFQLATLTVTRSLSRMYNNKYIVKVICVPVVTPDTIKYVEGIGEDYPTKFNNLRLVMITRSRTDGETGYIEMTPTEVRPGGAIVFETSISVHDNLGSDMMLEIDRDNTPFMQSLITNGPRREKIFIDSAETSFHFAVMFRDYKNQSTTNLYDNESFQGFTMVNRFSNNHRDLTLYKPMNMMRSVITFAGVNDNYNIRVSLIPFLKYDVPLDEKRMSYFIRAFGEQYSAVEPVLKRLDSNSFLDFKLFNTYGRSNNYYIGPAENSDVLWNSDILLDNVYVTIKFRMAVHDRSTYVQTVDSVINDIISYFEFLSSGTIRDIHVSNLIRLIEEHHPNINYIRFLGFNSYGSDKQSIFTKYDDISELKDGLIPFVPEYLRVSRDSIQIIEEV